MHPRRTRLLALTPSALLGLALAVSLVSVNAGASSDSPGAQSGPRVPVLVELFTSEGCSSCPPADALLRELVASQPVEGAQIIGLSEHVDYWNRLGWTDPFSSALFSSRQSAYATTAGSSQVYTPQMIVDGDASFVGSDRTRALAAVRAAVNRAKSPIVLTWPEARRLDVSIPAGLSEANVPVWLVVSENGLSVEVARGENEGRTLTHDGVARRLLQIGRTAAYGAFHASLPVDLQPYWTADHLQVTVFVQSSGGPVTALGSTNYRSY